MFTELAAIIEGAAPTIAAALVPGPLSAPAGALATVAIAHLAEGLGLPHPADPKDIIDQLANLGNDAVKNAVLTRAESNFQTTLSPVVPAAPTSPAPTSPPTEAIQPAEHTGITSDLPSHIVYIILSIIGGGLAAKGIDLNNISLAILGSSDLHVGASIIAGAITLLWRDVRGTNANTKLMASSQQP
jgi:hypothetical protein